MKLGVKADNPLESIAMMSGVVPTPLVIGAWGMGFSRALIAAIRLEIFEAMEDGGEKTAEEVAAATGCDALGTETLLNALNGFGYVTRRDGRFSNAGQTRKWLLRSSKNSMVDTLLFYQDIWDQLGGLDEAVRTGEMRRFHDAQMPDGFWERYMRGLATMAKMAGKEVVRKVKLAEPPRRLLDVGGGHGMFSVAMCRKHEGLAATVLDLPEAAEIGRKLVDEEDFSGRVTYQEGDLRESDWGDGYDLVFIFNVLHNSTDEEGQAAVKRGFEALRPGGTLAVLDSEHREFSGNLSFISGYNELFFFLVSGTRAWPEATMRGWFEEAGFEGLKSKRLMMLPEVLITGRRPAG